MVHLPPDGRASFTTIVVFIILDSFAVILRIISKGKTKNRYSQDDWWILCALLLFFGWAGVRLYFLAGIGVSLDIDNFQDPLQTEESRKLLWVAELLFPLTITPVKISVLCFYRMAFPMPRFRHATYYMSALCGAWLFTSFGVLVFQCRPVRAVYDLKLAAGAHCVSLGNFVFAYELINTLTDICILALPLFMIRKLHLPTRHKLQLMSIFLMGGFVPIASILRIVYSYDPKYPERVPSYSRATLWSAIELGTALIGACLPTYRPLLPKSFAISDTFKHWYSSLFKSARSKTDNTSSGMSKTQVFDISRIDRNRNDSIGEEHLTQAVGGSDTDTQNSKWSVSTEYQLPKEATI